MKSRRDTSAETEGGRHARPLAIIWRIILSFAVCALLIFALQQTPESNPPVTFGQMEVESPDGENRRQIDWGNLSQCIVAWVEVPGTSIDEPIAQATSDNPNYYLYRDALGEGNYGTLYIDCDCSVDSPFTIVYGHHMSDGSAFADFAGFIDRAYAEDHKTIYVYTRAENQRHELSIIAVDVVNANKERIRTSFKDDESRETYLAEAISNSDVVLDDVDISDKQIWAFATCSYQTSNSRTLLYCSLS